MMSNSLRELRRERWVMRIANPPTPNLGTSPFAQGSMRGMLQTLKNAAAAKLPLTPFIPERELMQRGGRAMPRPAGGTP